MPTIPSSHSGNAGQPLRNFRILDLSRIWAGPYCTKLLADMGAEVIKMESLSVYDSHRGPVSPAPGIVSYPDADPGEQPWNRNGWFNCLHMSKYGITLELTGESGRQVFNELVSISDVLVENFRQGSLERLGYSYEELRRLRPDLIYVSMPAFGNGGPWQKYVAYGIGQEQLSGMAHMTGYRGEGPMKSGINHGDPITGSHAAGVLLAALRHRRRTGEGMFIDVSQQESAVALIGGEMLAYQMTGAEPERRGNRSPWFAPHNSYQCAGEDRWVTIAVTSDGQWLRLAGILGDAELAADARYATVSDRMEHQDALDALIGAWAADKDAYDICRQLQEFGIPSSPVMGGPDLLSDDHYAARGTFVEIDHPQVGPKMYPGAAWKMSATPGRVRWPSPTLGQHNHLIYRELLGMPPERISGLEEEGVIGVKPTGSRII